MAADGKRQPKAGCMRCKCPLLDDSGQIFVFGQGGLSAYDPTAKVGKYD